MEKLHIALFQLDTVWGQPRVNCERVEAWVDSRAQRADLVVLPEMFGTGFDMNPVKIAQEPDGEIATRMQALATRTGKAIIGSVAVRDRLRRGEGGEEIGFFNRLFFWTPDAGAFTYDKRHLFRMAGEQERYVGGQTRLIVPYKGLRICPLICYDLRFPLWSRQRPGEEYDLLIYVASWPQVRRYAWSALLRARAIENLAYVVGVNRVGSDPQNDYSGDSVALDFLGMPVAQVEPCTEGVASAVLDGAALREFREGFPADRDADRFVIKD